MMSAATKLALENALAALLDSIAADVGNQPGDLAKLTEVKLDGTGVFDKLMAACNLHIQAEFTADRLRGTDYANVYLGMMQACLNTATTFVIQWDKSVLEKANLLTNLLNSLNQADLIVAQTMLYRQKTVTEIAETNTSMPNINAGDDLTAIIPHIGSKVEGAKGANRDVTLEQRAGYQRKAINDLIKIATGHVDMLVSSGAATNVGNYTADLLQLLQTGNATANFPAGSLLTKAVADASSLSPSDADSTP